MDRGMIKVKLVDDKEVVIRQLVHCTVNEPFDLRAVESPLLNRFPLLAFFQGFHLPAFPLICTLQGHICTSSCL